MSEVRVLRPMGLLEIIDHSFRLYRSNFWLFFGIAAVVQIPFNIIVGLPELMGTGQTAEFDVAYIFYGLAVVFLLAFVMILSTGAMTKAVSDRYLGEESTIKQAYNYIFKRFFPFTATLILAWLLMVSGLILCGVGMIIFAFWIAFVAQVFVIEDKRYGTAIWRSKFLIGQGVWATLMVINLMVAILSTLLQTPLYALQAINLGLMSEPSFSLSAINVLLSGIIQSVAWPLGQIAAILLYYDSRIRKEGFDIQMLANEMGRTLPAGSVPASGATSPAVSSQGPAASAEAAPPTEPAPPADSAPESHTGDEGERDS